VDINKTQAIIGNQNRDAQIQTHRIASFQVFSRMDKVSTSVFLQQHYISKHRALLEKD
jgi:hypothetical protein